MADEGGGGEGEGNLEKKKAFYDRVMKMHGDMTDQIKKEQKNRQVNRFVCRGMLIRDATWSFPSYD